MTRKAQTQPNVGNDIYDLCLKTASLACGAVGVTFS